MITWPPGLRFAAAVPNLSASWRSGGAALSGHDQRVVGDFGAWRVTVEDVTARGPDQIRAAGAMLARLKAGEVLLAPVCERAPILGAQMGRAVIVAPVALRATVIAVAVEGAALATGALIGLGARVHRVVEIVDGPPEAPLRNQIAADAPWSDALPFADATLGAGAPVYTLRILPGLRHALAAGDPVALRDLRLACRLAVADDGDMPAPVGRSVKFSLPLVETL